MNKSIEDKWAPILNNNPQKKQRKAQEPEKEKTSDPKPSCSFSNPEEEEIEEEEDTNLDFNVSEEEFVFSEDESEKNVCSKNKKKKFTVAPTVIFSPENVPKLISDNMEVSSPLTKNSCYSINISNKTIGLLKGHMENPMSSEKFDIKTKDSEMLEIFSHFNSKFPVADIPDNCFSLSPTIRLPLKAIYRTLHKQQQVLKALFLHVELNIDNFNVKNEKKAKELVKAFIQPIDIQISLIHDTIKKIRAIATPNFLPASIKKTLRSAPILPGKIWNISSQMVSRIQTQKTESYKSFKNNSFKPFQNRGRFSDRRGRPQRRGGPIRRKNQDKSDYKQEKYREN